MSINITNDSNNNMNIIKSIIYMSAFAMAVSMTSCHDAHDGHDHGHEAESHANGDVHDHEESHVHKSGDHIHEADEHSGESKAHAHASDEIEFTAAQAKACGLQVTVLQPSEFSEIIRVSGRVLPANGAESTVTATMSGIVKYASAPLTEGAAVSSGKPLFVIDAAQMADGNPAAAAQSEAAAAKAAYERACRLAEDNIISQSELEAALNRHRAAAAAAKSLGDARQSRAVSSPMRGYVRDLLVKPGDYVTAGQPLATITQDIRLQLRADVPERHFNFLPGIHTATFRMAYDTSKKVYDMSELGGRLVSRGRITETGDHFVPVTFEFTGRGDIVAGSFTEVYLKGARRGGVLAVPVEAVTEAQGLHFVYVQTRANAYRRTEVRLGATDGRRVEILSGLKPGDRVVTKGAVQVRLAANESVAPEGHSH